MATDTAIAERQATATRPAPQRADALPAPTFAAAWRGLAWWRQALVIFGASRIVSTILWLFVIQLARPESRIGVHANLVDAMSAWDGQWYALIAAAGYPTHLPAPVDGVAQTNAWAFLPAYPALVKALSFGYAPLWSLTAELTSIAFGFGAAVLLAMLLRPHVGKRGALTAVLFFSFSPVAFILQAAYAESMGLFLTFAVLVLIDRHRYLAATAVCLALALTRPGMQAVALTVALHLAVRVVAAVRGGARLPRRELAAGVLLLAVATASGWLWSTIAAGVTGRPDAYLETELAWRAVWTGNTPFQPFTSWLFAADFWAGGLGPVVLAVLGGGGVALLLCRPVRALGTTTRIWLLAWPLYLLAVFFPQSSTFRLLMPIAPLGGAIAAGRSRRALAVLVLISIGLQGLWLYATYGDWRYFWNVP